MKILHVIDEDDTYAAMGFEQYLDSRAGSVALRDAWDEASKRGFVEFGEAGKVVRIRARAWEFGDVDSDFIDFIRSEFMDHDECKQSNFYEVK